VTRGAAGDERLVVAPDEAGRRLDLFLAARLPGLSRSEIQRLIRLGHVKAGGHSAKAGAAVRAGTTVEISIPPAAPPLPVAEALPLSILYDDADLVVVNKPAGMVVHPGAGHAHGTLVNALLHHVRGLSGIGGVERPGIVHRLDRGTSGVMVIAKNDRAHRDLARQFHDREVTKEYLALVWGSLGRGKTMAGSIGRDPRHRLKMSSRARHARPALTTIVESEPLGGVSLVKIRIGTGRTHQIRVHLSEAGHPVVGDELYGGVRRRPAATLAPVGRLKRPFLHASHLAFTHPADGRSLGFDAPLPNDLEDVLRALGSAAARPTP